MIGGRMRFGWTSAALVALACSMIPRVGGAQCPAPAASFEPDPEFSSSFLERNCKFETTGANPFFILKPGWRIVLESEDEVAEITVLNRTRKVAGVRTRVVEERSFEKNGDELVLTERSLNYFAICKQTNSVFYFGEDVELFDEDGNVISNEGAWLAGRDNAKPGIIMPGSFLVGGGFYQEIAPENSALDKSRITSLSTGCEVDGLELHGQCLETIDTSDCSGDQTTKIYAQGIGIAVDGELVLTEFGFSRDRHPDGD